PTAPNTPPPPPPPPSASPSQRRGRTPRPAPPPSTTASRCPYSPNRPPLGYNDGVPPSESAAMTTATITPPPAAAPSPAAPATPVTYWASPSIARISVARYQQMIAAGILTHDDKVELLEGYLVLKM